MAFRDTKDAVSAHRDQVKFTRYEASCILANVEPNSDMNSSETANLQEYQRFFDELTEMRRKFGNDALFAKLIS